MTTKQTPAAAVAVSATIDGVTVRAEANETILHCARRYGIHIPSLCELDDIDHAPGTCRICQVEILGDGGGQAHLAPSCITPVEEGMAVMTHSPRARAAQRLQVELMFADHNLDCVVCKRHGNCELQDVARVVGLDTNRFRDPARIAARHVDDTSPALIRDMTRCVRCQRCVTVCREGQTVDALVMTGFGQELEVGLKHGLSQTESTCVSCGQCVLVCPTGALGEREEIDTVEDFLYDPGIVTVFQFAPAIRVSVGEEFGLPAGANVQGQIVAALRKLGADIVLDTNFGADVVIMEEGTELLRHLVEKKRPTFTSCCPAWINFAERHYPAILPYLSSTKSPQQTVGVIAKTYLPQKMGLDPKAIRVVSIMPCTAKKDERVRPQLSLDGTDEIDVVLTTREFVHLLGRRGIDLSALEPSTYDNPYMSAFSGAGAIFGTTGGVMEAAVRTMYYVVTGREMQPIELGQLRGFEGVRTATVDIGGDIGPVKVAMCHGLKSVRGIVEAVLDGTADLDFIEVMACPGGCVDGGGSLRSKKQYLPHALKRRETLFSIDHVANVRQSHNNPQVQELYKSFLGSPYSELAHQLLHTYYTDRHVEMTRSVKDIWDSITMSTVIY
ncbi:[FeFe] hydrogenase, group A [Oleispirillum naphthae]|uniref:[FeFe] hydrogenase, group A n=1 Tax=Oleispirillum naphthae TaxID=2838853 RepID=UPI0030823CB5